MTHNQTALKRAAGVELLREIAVTPLNLATGIARQVGRGAAGLVTQIKIARMQSALSSMSDADLARIELKRSDIRARAKFLTEYKYDGL